MAYAYAQEHQDNYNFSTITILEIRLMGLKMNIAKSKVMVADNNTIKVNNALTEHVECNVCVGQHCSLKEKYQDKEIQLRIIPGWAAYANTGISSKATLPSH